MSRRQPRATQVEPTQAISETQTGQQKTKPDPPKSSASVRVPLAVKTNLAPWSPKNKNIQKPSLETTCLSSFAPKRLKIQRTPSIRLGEGIGGKATVVFEETETPLLAAEHNKSTLKKRKPSNKSTGVKKFRGEEDPGKENIPPIVPLTSRNNRELRSADLEEIALGLVALRDGR